jgi:hypothetical protein
MVNKTNIAYVYVPAEVLKQSVPGLFAVSVDDLILKSIKPENIYKPEAVHTWQKAQDQATS